MKIRVGILVLFLVLFLALLWGCRSLDYQLVATEGVRSLADPGRNTAVAEVAGVSYLVETRPLPSAHPAPDDSENLHQEYNKLALQKGILPDAEFQRREDDLKARMERLDAVAPQGADSAEAPPGGRAEMVLTFADTGASYLRLVTIAEGSTPLVFVFRRVHS